MEIKFNWMGENEEAEVELGIFNRTGYVYGVQAGLVNVALESNGFQGGVFNIAEKSNGVQFGIANYIRRFGNFKGKSNGVQAGLVNVAEESDVYGVQAAALSNVTENLRGVQIASLLNICGEDSVGVQFGLINYRDGVEWYQRAIPILAIRKRKNIEERLLIENKGPQVK